MIPFLLAFFLLSPPGFPSQNEAKTHIQTAENLLKDGKPIEAYREADLAVWLEPKNKKY